ncbi:hypothetical protein [Crystallibacter crystallopoietes]|uniref:hypothetical protein n=1 Tax=Crystallibacter crystallopoietes TaxID=37928 RepID=UPI0012373A24|nr:hypothetical protein [Arthrobacter crystallopoietes]
MSAFFRSPWSRTLSVGLALAITAATAQIAQATETEASGEAAAEQIAEITDEARADAGVADTGQVAFVQDGAVTTAVDADGGISFADGTVTVAEGSTVPMGISLPSEAPADATVTEAGTLVTTDQDTPVSMEVQGFEDGSVRIQAVVEEAAPVHELGYELSLPAGAQLHQQPDGSVIVLADPAAVPVLDAEPLPEGDAALAELLPTAEEVDTAAVDAANAEAAALSAGDPVDTAPAGTVALAAMPTPWAVDATGQSLPTEYKVEGDTVVQVVDTSQAVFPVVSDPWFIPLIPIALGAAARALAPAAIRAFAATAIRGGMAYTTRGGYRSFSAFKAAHGTRSGYEWHHIVTQAAGRYKGYSSYAINHRNNLIQIPARVHRNCVTPWMNSKGVKRFGANAASGQYMRDWVKHQSWQKQHQIGVALLRHCGVRI